MNKIIKGLTVLFFVFFNFGCNAGMNISQFDVGMKNTGKQKIKNASVELGSSINNFGVLVSDGEATNLFAKYDISEKAVISYKINNNTVEKAILIDWEKVKEIKGQLRVFFYVNSDTGEIKIDFQQYQKINGEDILISLLTGKEVPRE